MKSQFNLENVLEVGKLRNELEYERALIADRKLRILCKDNYRLKPLRSKLRDLIEKYEGKNWPLDSKISESRMLESDRAELIAETERLFIQRRKQLIKKQLKKYSLTQQDLCKLLGHTSKTYMSELINGLSPFTLTDLIVIHRLLRIDLKKLVPTSLSSAQRIKIGKSIQEIGTHKLKLGNEDFDLVLT